jgi:hypothetical protein
MYKFAKIEKLIEKTIPKLLMPAELGEAPNWNPEKDKTKPNGGKKRIFRKKTHSAPLKPTSKI